MNSIYYFDVIEINELFGKSKLSLSRWLLESLARLAVTIAIVTTISRCKLLCLIVVLCSSSDSATPYYIKAVVIDWDIDIVGCSGL